MCWDRVLGLAWGLVLEPLVDPKPGAVTRLRGHSDKDAFSYGVGSLAGVEACFMACQGWCEGVVARALEAYLRGLRSLRVGVNLQLGSVLLLAPLCNRIPYVSSVGELLEEGSRCARGLGKADAQAYYKALEELGVGHLGRYEGRIPGVGSGSYPQSFLDVLKAGSWDHVHRELLEGYPLTKGAVEVILSHGGPGREEALIEALAWLISEHGDTLIASKYGWSAYKRSLWEARVAVKLWGARRGLELLDREWRMRGWNPGAALDILAVATGVSILAWRGLLRA